MTTSKQTQDLRRRLVILALALAVVAAVPRFYGLRERGFFYHDEAGYYASSYLYGNLARWGLYTSIEEGQPVTIQSLRDKVVQLHANGGTLRQYARPLHNLLTTIAVIVVGAQDYAGLYVSALAGLVGVIVLACLGFQVFRNPLVGLLGGLLFAISIWHVHYSRSALAQALAVLCALTTLLLLWRSLQDRSMRNLVWTGVYAGLSMTAHYNQFWIPVLVGLIHLVVAIRSGLRRNLKALAALGAGILSPIAAFEIVYQIGVQAVRSTSLGQLNKGSLLTYSEQIYAQLTFWNASNMPSRNLWLFPTSVLEIESPLLAGLIFFGIASLAVASTRGGSRRQSRLLLLWLAVPVVIWSLFGYPAPRSFIVALPVALLGAAWGMVQIKEWLETHHGQRMAATALMAIVLITVVAQVGILVPVVTARSGWKMAAQQLIQYSAQHPGATIPESYVLTYSQPLLKYYMGSLIELDATDGDYFIGDVGAIGNPALEEMWLRYRSECQPIITVPNDMRHGMIMADAFGASQMSDYQRTLPTYAIEIYDRRNCFR